MPLPQKSSTSAKESEKNQAKKAGSAQGKQAGKDRKELTGRDHQGNHDSKTKPDVRGGLKGDKHDNGVKQAGKAGVKK